MLFAIYMSKILLSIISHLGTMLFRFHALSCNRFYILWLTVYNRSTIIAVHIHLLIYHLRIPRAPVRDVCAFILNSNTRRNKDI